MHAEAAARATDIRDRRRMIVGLVFAIPMFVLSMSRDLGLLGKLFGAALAPRSSAMMAMGAPLPLAQIIMNWMLFTLTLPVMVITARPFFVHGYKALRNGAANMDVLVALGSGVAFAYSVLTLLGAFSGPWQRRQPSGTSPHRNLAVIQTREYAFKVTREFLYLVVPVKVRQQAI